VQNGAPGCKCDELNFEKIEFSDCDMLYRAWQGLYRSALKGATSLASTNPHQIMRAETAVSPVALLQSGCRNDTQ